METGVKYLDDVKVAASVAEETTGIAWPNVGNIVYTDGGDQGYKRRGRPSAPPPKAWKVLKETHSHVYLCAVKPEGGPGGAFKETMTLKKRDASALRAFYATPADVWAVRIAAAREELGYAVDDQKDAKKSLDRAKKRVAKAKTELAKTIALSRKK